MVPGGFLHSLVGSVDHFRHSSKRALLRNHAVVDTRNRRVSHESVVIMNADTQKLCDLIGKFRTAMLVTHTPDAQLRAVPMIIAQVEPSGRVWFLTARDSGKAHDLENDERVQLIFSDDHAHYLTVAGQGTLSTSRAKIDE